MKQGKHIVTITAADNKPVTKLSLKPTVKDWCMPKQTGFFSSKELPKNIQACIVPEPMVRLMIKAQTVWINELTMLNLQLAVAKKKLDGNSFIVLNSKDEIITIKPNGERKGEILEFGQDAKIILEMWKLRRLM